MGRPGEVNDTGAGMPCSADHVPEGGPSAFGLQLTLDMKPQEAEVPLTGDYCVCLLYTTHWLDFIHTRTYTHTHTQSVITEL